MRRVRVAGPPDLPVVAPGWLAVGLGVPSFHLVQVLALAEVQFAEHAGAGHCRHDEIVAGIAVIFGQHIFSGACSRCFQQPTGLLQTDRCRYLAQHVDAPLERGYRLRYMVLLRRRNNNCIHPVQQLVVVVYGGDTKPGHEGRPCRRVWLVNRTDRRPIVGGA